MGETTKNARAGVDVPAGNYTVKIQANDNPPSAATLTLKVEAQHIVYHTGEHQADRAGRFYAPNTGWAWYDQVIRDSADVWSDATGDYILLCEAGSCSGRNSDGQRVTIEMVKGVKGSTRDTWRANGDCGQSIACVIPDSGTWRTPWNHIGHVTLRIEEPPYALSVPFYWTNDIRSHGRPLASGQTGRYMFAVILHEWGHVLGLSRSLPERGPL